MGRRRVLAGWDMDVSPGASHTVKLDHTDRNANSAEASQAISGRVRVRRAPEEARRLILETAQSLIAALVRTHSTQKEG